MLLEHQALLEGNYMAKINKMMVGESLVGDGNEVAHIDLIIGPRGSAAETAFANALTNNKDGFTTLLAVVAPNLAVKPQHDDVQQGHDQGRQAGRADVRPGAVRASPRPSPTAWPMAPSRSAKPTTCSSPSACSSTGKPRTTRRSRITTTGDQGSYRARRRTASRRRPRSSRSARKLSTPLLWTPDHTVRAVDGMNNLAGS